ncbi:Delta-aminolevulinic acid dehydratase [bacterium HR36]|nr:Delta-aminolevulinic acid dehydratase [bacterium HR36]
MSELSPRFPEMRMRRLRRLPALRQLVRETDLRPSDLVLPLFVRPGQGLRQEIPSMPGQYQHSPDTLVETASRAWELGIRAVILFGIPAYKDEVGSAALDEAGIIPQAILALKRRLPDLLVITDECFCEYTSHGHCGVLSEKGGRRDVDNDRTLEQLGQQSVVHARAGADMVAPSGMMDGMVAAVRHALDAAGFEHIHILSYAAKYASGFYGPFREAAESPPQFGDRSTYQMDPANAAEALREIALDLAEGADIVMVKPALAYLDILRRAKERFGVPLAAYNVSGEYAMVKAAAARGWLDERRIVLEILTAIKRAGASFILTYHALDAAAWLSE